MKTTRLMQNQIIADKADNVTWAATGITMLSAMLEWLHIHFGWLFSTAGLALLSVVIGIISALIGVYYRRRDAKFTANREAREHAVFTATMERMHGPNWKEIIGWSGYDGT